MLIWILIIAVSVLLDQVSKLLVYGFLDREESLYLIKGVLRFTYVENTGAAFGMLSDKRWVFMVLSVVAIVALLLYLWKFRPESRFACMAMSMIIAGGIGNMIDRVLRSGVDANGNTYYYVVDFIDFCAFPNLWMWVFNFADICVCVGGGCLVIWLIMSIITEYKEEQAKKEDARASDDK